MPTPDFVLALREKIGNDPLWLTGVTAVVLHGTRVLLVKRSDTGAWTPVTGIVDPGEHPATAAERETLEEAAIVAEADVLAWVGVTGPVVYANGDRSQYIDLVFRMDYVSGEPYPADGENTDAAWFPIDALPEMSTDMRMRIRHALDAGSKPRFKR